MIETIRDEALDRNAEHLGERLRAGLESLDLVKSVRGLGLLVAAELEVPAAPVVAKCLEEGLLVNAVRPHSVRFAPPLVVNATEINRGLSIFSRVLSTFAEQPAPASA